MTKAAGALDAALRRYERYEEPLEITVQGGQVNFDGKRVGNNRLLVITHMSAYDLDSAATYIRLGYWDRSRYIWVKVVPAPLVLETVEFNGELYLGEGMWPAIQFDGTTGDDDLFGLFQGYWVRAPRIS